MTEPEQENQYSDNDSEIEKTTPLEVTITNQKEDKPEINQYQDIEEPPKCPEITEEQIKEFLEESKE